MRFLFIFLLVSNIQASDVEKELDTCVREIYVVNYDEETNGRIEQHCYDRYCEAIGNGYY